jgi:tetratricopeptide (TPR) repeat protein
MLAHTWVDVIPYKYDQRRRGIVASIKVLTEVIEGCFSGRIPKLPMGLNRPTAGMTDCIRSLDWLFGHRHYFDCFALAEAATASIQRPNASACLVGAIAGVNAGIAVDRVDGVAERTTSSLRSVRDRGLRSYLRALKASRSSPRNIPHILKRFSIARGHFHDAADQLYESIAMDQLARAHQDNGDIEPAKVCFAESIRLKGRIGDDVGLAASLGGLALLHMNTWEFTEARSLLLKDLESVQQREDIATEIRIHNWLGQIVLYADWNILEAIKDFEKSLRMAESFHGAGYDPVPDVAFAHIGMGFAYAAASTPQSALNSEQSARQYLKQMRGMAGDSAATICEILSGQILLLDGDSISAAIRLTGSLHHLLEISALYHADYTVRLCNFLKQQDRQGLAARFAIPALRNPITSASSNLHRILTEFGEGS